MYLIKQEKNGCVYASLAMVLNEKLETITRHFNTWGYEQGQMYPFLGEWETLPRVPSMHEICEVAMFHYDTGFVPFQRDPEVAPHPDCPPIRVWEHIQNRSVDAEGMFRAQLSRGPGLIEGFKDDTGHMVAWDGSIIYDPRGYCYSPNVADRFDFEPRRFWLAVRTK